MGISVDDLLRQVRNLFDLEVLMMKRYINYSIVYTVLAMISGVFYREFTRMNDYYCLDDFIGCSYTLFYLGYDVLFDSWIGFNEH